MKKRPSTQHFATKRDASGNDSATRSRRKGLPSNPKPHTAPIHRDGEQYFAASPSVAAHPRELEVELGGMTFRVHTDTGVFSGAGLDKGTAVLLRKVPDLPETGVFVDVGCGWGPLSLVMARSRPTAQVIGVDVNERALELTAKNAWENGLGNIEVLAEAAALARLADGSVDVIWSNPPVRIGKAALHRMWTAWRAKLRPGGVAYLVMGRNLGADTFAVWAGQHGWEVEKIASSKGFRVFRLTPADT